MKKEKVAIINNMIYCKFPGDINDIRAFIDFLTKNMNTFVELETIVEKGCVAPYFIEEDFQTEIQYWNPTSIRLVKEGEISILRRWEYEEQLKKVIQDKCVHCVSYTEDTCEGDYKTHIENIDLDGNCYGFERKKD